MKTEQAQENDHFWLYVAILSTVLISIVGMVKLSENEKYDPIAKQQRAETSNLNIRVVREY